MGVPQRIIALEATLLWAYLLYNRVQACRSFKISPFYALTLPFGALVFTAMMFASTFKVSRARGSPGGDAHTNRINNTEYALRNTIPLPSQQHIRHLRGIFQNQICPRAAQLILLAKAAQHPHRLRPGRLSGADIHPVSPIIRQASGGTPICPAAHRIGSG